MITPDITSIQNHSSYFAWHQQLVSMEYKWDNDWTLSFSSGTNATKPSHLFNCAHLSLVSIQLCNLMICVLCQMIWLQLLDSNEQDWSISDFNLYSNNSCLSYQANIKSWCFHKPEQVQDHLGMLPDFSSIQFLAILLYQRNRTNAPSLWETCSWHWTCNKWCMWSGVLDFP